MRKSERWRLFWFLWLIPTYVGAMIMGTYSRIWMHTHHQEKLFIPLLGGMILIIMANKMFIFDWIDSKRRMYLNQEIQAYIEQVRESIRKEVEALTANEQEH